MHPCTLSIIKILLINSIQNCTPVHLQLLWFTLPSIIKKGKETFWRGWCDLWWWWASSHHCRNEEVADEIEEQGNIFRYLTAVLLLMTSFVPSYFNPTSVQHSVHFFSCYNGMFSLKWHTHRNVRGWSGHLECNEILWNLLSGTCHNFKPSE